MGFEDLGFPPWKGYFPALITPFNRNLSIDWKGLETLLAWLLEEGMHGFVVAGTTGEWTALTFTERCQLFEASRNCIPASRPLIAGCSALRIEDSLAYMQAAAGLQMDGVLLTVPPYACPSEVETLEYFRTAAEQSPLPIIAYNWPQGTGVDFSLSLVKQLIQLSGESLFKKQQRSLKFLLENS